MLSLALSLPLSLALLVSARIHHSRVPEDPYAFPKYRVSFLHGLPVLNQTAERWLRDGLRGGEAEFLDHPWQESQWHASPLKSIEAGDDSQSDPASERGSNYTLQHMRFGPKSSFVCLVPPQPQDDPPAVEDSATDVATPVHSWSLLQPLSGKCLYHRQGWFTYSYCHNSHVRQFHELHHQHIPSTGEYKPEEDPDWEAYTLGRAPPTLEAGAELTTAEAAAAANLELARGAGSRYLVQRWGDGTYCDKTGRKRDVEIQFHCSMTMTDTILFVKETQTCHYVIHIATPRLCGEPGFRSRIDAEEEHVIQCREVLAEDEYTAADRSLPAAPHPFRRARTQKKVIAPPPDQPAAKAEGVDGTKEDGADPHEELLRRAIQRLLARKGLGGADSHVVVEQLPDGEGELLIEFVDIDLGEVDGEDGEGAYYEDAEYADDGWLADGQPLDGRRLQEILRAAGLGTRGQKTQQQAPGNSRSGGARGSQAGETDKDEDAAEEGSAAKKPRDEL
ncbi:glucosidase II beta subunit-like protein-domain-containing protein [Cubamyces lactineus]|nr:glucosidase II beta subunit-like protein-domain-containing protein [Cubamyces lactineus]